MMDRQLYLSELYDLYGELLTEKQRKNFEEYYFDDLSLSELSENYEVSRNAIHKSIKESIDKLEFYEKKLHIYEKNLKLQELAKKYPEIGKRIEKIIEKG